MRDLPSSSGNGLVIASGELESAQIQTVTTMSKSKQMMGKTNFLAHLAKIAIALHAKKNFMRITNVRT